MAQENTAINDLIHLVTAPKLEERESQDDLFWIRDQANLKARQARRGAQGTPAPAILAHGVPLPGTPAIYAPAHPPIPSYGASAAPARIEPMRMLPMNPVVHGPIGQTTHPDSPHALAGAQIGTTTLPIGSVAAQQAMLQGAFVGEPPEHAAPDTEPFPFSYTHEEPAPKPAVVAPAAQPSMTLPSSGSVPAVVAPAAQPSMTLRSSGSAPVGSPAGAAGARHAARVAAARANAGAIGPAARAAAARAAARASQAPDGRAHSGALPAVTPVFHEPDDEATSHWTPSGSTAPATLPLPGVAIPRMMPGQVSAVATAGQHPLALAIPEATMRVAPLDLPLPGQTASTVRAFVAELLHTIRRFAVPLAILMIVSIFAGGYVAFDGQGKKPKRSPGVTDAVATAASTTAGSPATPPDDPASGSESASIAGASTPASDGGMPEIATTNESVASIVTAKLAAAHAAQSEEIEMEPVDVERARERARRRAEDRAERADRDRADRADRRRANRDDDDDRDRADRGRKKRDRATLDDVLGSSTARREPSTTKAEPRGRREASEGTLPASVANKTGAATGKLSVTSNVPALIYVDGRSTQMMTPKKLSLPAGAHKVTLLDPASRKAKTQDVEVIAGKVVTVDKTF